jgi:parallel beta-helix repeat protein
MIFQQGERDRGMNIKKLLAVGIILLFTGMALAPSITVSEPTSNQTVYSDDNGTLSGYVKDTSMNPIEGAKVRVYFHETYEENYTDPSGYYHVTNIPICFCLKNATASKDGYTTEWVLLAIGENTTLDFVLTPLGKTLYVGGSGAGNYTTIPSAIDDANSGDTVFVYSGTYFENVIVDKSIVLVGEDRNSTIIDGLNKGSVIYVKVESVLIENFTIRNGTNGVKSDPYKTSISHNIIINNDKGIESSYSENVNIIGNIISKNNYGITFYRTKDSIIKGNHILSNKIIGILFNLATIPGLGCENNSVSYNIIQKNTIGIYLSDSPYNNINYNNFYQNIVDASFEYSVGNNWNHNYWNRPRILPKPVIGTIYYYIPWINFDWHPAKEPYDIP